jgi:hypothetical protein
VQEQQQVAARRPRTHIELNAATLSRTHHLRFGVRYARLRCQRLRLARDRLTSGGWWCVM